MSLLPLKILGNFQKRRRRKVIKLGTQFADAKIQSKRTSISKLVLTHLIAVSLAKSIQEHSQPRLVKSHPTPAHRQGER
jgi:hypothetical protein